TGMWRRTPTTSDEIRRSVDECILFQRQIGVEAIILPSPLTRDHSSDYSVESEWLEIGAERAAAIASDRPALATIAVSDTCPRGFRPRDNTLIDIILDQVSARARD